MASSDVDQKFLGKLAKAVEPSNALLASMLYKLLGLSITLAEPLFTAKKQRRLRTTPMSQSLVELNFHIIWLCKEGLVMLEQYILPMVGDYVELKVLAYKLRASFYHIFVLFHNSPPVSPHIPHPSARHATAPTAPTPEPRSHHARPDKGKGVARDDGSYATPYPSSPPTHPLHGGAVNPPPGFGPPSIEALAAFLLPTKDYVPAARQYFLEALHLADSLLWGSHSLRLSVRTEYAAFLYECVHDRAASRTLARDTIADVYAATHGMDDDMFRDACELVTVLDTMAKRGLPPGQPASP